jgi:hypothetical protein
VDACAAACRSNSSCQWFNWRRVEQARCRGGLQAVLGPACRW